MSVERMWPLHGELNPDGRHRVVHVWSTRWHTEPDENGSTRRSEAVTWAEAQELRGLVSQSEDISVGEIFEDQLERQYGRIEERVPRLVRDALEVKLVQPGPNGNTLRMDGHCFLARLPSGHLLACLNVLYDSPLDELPAILIDALACGPDLLLNVGDEEVPLARCFNEKLPWTGALVQRAQSELGWSRPLELHLTSEMHSLIYASDRDDTLFDQHGKPDEQLVARLIGRLGNDRTPVEDRAVLWPNEFNKVAGTMGAVRPGASIVAGSDPPGIKNAFVSTLILMTAASLLREARDEVYAVQECTASRIEADRTHFDWRGRGPLGKELTRLAHVDIAIAFDVESYLDMRRLISDAKLVQWHTCLAESLAIPQSVKSLHEMSTHLSSAMQTVSERATAQNALLVSLFAAVAAGLAVVVAVVVGGG